MFLGADVRGGQPRCVRSRFVGDRVEQVSYPGTHYRTTNQAADRAEVLAADSGEVGGGVGGGVAGEGAVKVAGVVEISMRCRPRELSKRHGQVLTTSQAPATPPLVILFMTTLPINNDRHRGTCSKSD